MKPSRHLIIALLVIISGGGYCTKALQIPPVYPVKRWQRKSPAGVGLEAKKLQELSDYAGGFGCVVRYGYMVYTWGNASRRKDVASAVKPLYTHFIFKAVEQGRIKSLDEPVVRYQPGLKTLNKKLGYKDRNITWRHLANQISCYGVQEQPGQAFDYSDYNMALLFDTLFLKVYGSAWGRVDQDVLHPMLTDPLGCQDNPTFMAFGTKDRPGRLAISPRDFARFGLLYLRQGRWAGKQLISKQHAAKATTSPLAATIPRTRGRPTEMLPGQRSIGGGNNQCDHNGSYSYAWWVNGIGRDAKRNWPDVPADVYGCFGHGDIRAMVVMPSLNLIVSWNDTKIRGSKMVNHALKLLTDAAAECRRQPPKVSSDCPKQTKAQNGQIIVDPEHPQWLKYKGHGPFFMCGPGDPEDFLYRGRLKPDGTRLGDQMALIEELKQTGANCIYLMAVRSHGGDGDKTQNPFVNNDPQKGLHPKVLEQWEKWFTEMDKNRIVIYFFFFDDSARVWPQGDTVPDEERNFIRVLVDRFKHYKNLIWCVAEEYSEAFTAKRVKNIAAQIRAADDFNHPIAVHKHSGLDFSEFADEPNIDQFAIQYNVQTADALHEGIVRAWKRAKGRYNLNMSEAKGFGTGRHLRNKIWACALAGAYVMVLDMDIASTAQGDLQACGHLVRFFQSTNFNEMSPHDELAYAQTKYVLAQPGRSYIAYSPHLQGKIGLKALTAGTYEFRWFDCATGNYLTPKKVKLGGGNQTWEKPPGIGNELAVYIRRIDK